MDDWPWGGWVLMTITMVAFWALVAGLVVFAIRASRPPAPHTSNPERVLAGRFASGEIDEDEFDRRLDALRASAKSPKRLAGPPPASAKQALRRAVIRCGE
jgi:putative membrane protein